jgi:hypothetical protein
MGKKFVSIICLPSSSSNEKDGERLVMKVNRRKERVSEEQTKFIIFLMSILFLFRLINYLCAAHVYIEK